MAEALSDESVGHHAGTMSSEDSDVESPRWERRVPLPLKNDNREGTLDKRNNRYPYCIVWTPIPILTWLFPCIGHMGIGDSRGVIYDFAGPEYIGVGNLAFGNPCRYLTLHPERVGDGPLTPVQRFNNAIRSGNMEYSKRNHNLW